MLPVSVHEIILVDHFSSSLLRFSIFADKLFFYSHLRLNNFKKCLSKEINLSAQTGQTVKTVTVSGKIFLQVFEVVSGESIDIYIIM